MDQLYAPPSHERPPKTSGLGHSLKRLLSATWPRLGFGVLYISVLAADLSGLMVLMGTVLLMTLALLGLILREVVLLIVGLDERRWHNAMALAVLLSALPLGCWGGSALTRARFWYFQDRYEAVAQQVLAGTYPNRLRERDAVLGYHVASYPGGYVVFGTVTHGFAGHAGFIRLPPGATPSGPPPKGWHWYGPQLAENWYIVGN